MPTDRRRLDFVLYAATRLGKALCCDVTLASLALAIPTVTATALR